MSTGIASAADRLRLTASPVRVSLDRREAELQKAHSELDSLCGQIDRLLDLGRDASRLQAELKELRLRIKGLEQMRDALKLKLQKEPQ